MFKQSIKRDSERKKASYFIFGLIFLVLIVLSIFPDSLAPFSPSESNYDQLLKKPSKLNLFGTDELGRDILSRIIYGTRVSLSVAVFTSIISLVFGTIYGLFKNQSVIIENCHFQSDKDFLQVSGNFDGINNYKIDRIQLAYQENYLINFYKLKEMGHA